jgi:hypothetical protein
MLRASSLKTIPPIARGVVSCLARRPSIIRTSPMSSSPRPGDSSSLAPRRRTSGNARAWSCSFTNPPPSPMRPSPLAWTSIPIRSAVGDDAGPEASSLSRTIPAGAASRPFPPLDRAIVTSIACDVVARTGNPLSRQSTTDLARRARDELNKPISRSTVWRILDEDAIKPWQYEHWIFPRASDFFEKAAVVLDLYEGYWHGERVDPFDRIISSDEKTSIQARIRCHATLGPASGRRRRVEAEYGRGGALQ